MLQWFCLRFIHFIWIRIGTDLPVTQGHDPGGILFCQFRVVRDHHNQTVFCHLLKQIHDLHTGIAVQRSGWLICQ